MTRGWTDQRNRRETLLVTYDGQEYVRDLVKIRAAWKRRQMEGGLRNVPALAEKVGAHATVVWRFLAGMEQCSKAMTLRILAELSVDFDDVHTKVDSTATSAET